MLRCRTELGGEMLNIIMHINTTYDNHTKNGGQLIMQISNLPYSTAHKMIWFNQRNAINHIDGAPVTAWQTVLFQPLEANVILANLHRHANIHVHKYDDQLAAWFVHNY